MASEDVKLILATHVFGNPAETDGLQTLASTLGSRLVFDAAHAYGSLRKGVHVGSFGDAEVFSLSGTKVVTSAEGGLVASRNSQLLERFLLARGYGFLRDYNTKIVGLNGKMSELHAALGILSLRRIEAALDARAARLKYYRQRLAQLDNLAYQVICKEDRSTYKDFAVLFTDHSTRNAAEQALATAGVQTKRYFLPCHRMDAFRRYATKSLPITEDTYDRILCLPLYESLTFDQIDSICDVLTRTIS
jgi:dTDP-4-amino-4,6-dideoxygalactose transaminase